MSYTKSGGIKIRIIKIGVFLIFVCTILLSGCDNEKVITNPIDMVDRKSEINNKIEKYDSPYTLCYKNKDKTYSMYIFSSPIQFLKNNRYELVDNTIVTSKDKNFSFENKNNDIKTYYPKTLKDFFVIKKESEYLSFKPNFNVESFTEGVIKTITNMYGDKVSAVVYESQNMDLIFYSTKSGIKNEIHLKKDIGINKIDYVVNSSSSYFEDKKNGYILFKTENDNNESIIYSPLIKSINDNKFDINNKIDINQKNKDYIVSLEINNSIKYPIKLDPSFELYQSKIPDTSVYSKLNTNSYLNNYAVIGNHPTLGEGWEYIRFKFENLILLSKEKVLNVNYFVRSLFNYPDDLKVYVPQEEWSSTQIVWDTRIYEKSKITLPFSKINKNIVVDINNKDLLFNDEQIGVLFKSSSQFSIITNSDNSMYPTYVEIVVEKPPKFFYPLKDINPPN